MKKEYVFTNNENKLEIIPPFEFLRGIENKGKLMGYAKNKKGEKFAIYPAPCSFETCYCWATAKKIFKKK